MWRKADRADLPLEMLPDRTGLLVGVTPGSHGHFQREGFCTPLESGQEGGAHRPQCDGRRAQRWEVTAVLHRNQTRGQEEIKSALKCFHLERNQRETGAYCP